MESEYIEIEVDPQTPREGDESGTCQKLSVASGQSATSQCLSSLSGRLGERNLCPRRSSMGSTASTAGQANTGDFKGA